MENCTEVFTSPKTWEILVVYNALQSQDVEAIIEEDDIIMGLKTVNPRMLVDSTLAFPAGNIYKVSVLPEDIKRAREIIEIIHFDEIEKERKPKLSQQEFDELARKSKWIVILVFAFLIGVPLLFQLIDYIRQHY